MPSLTLADLDRKDAAQALRLKVWIGRAGELIDKKVSDAEAHAVKALTATLTATPEGRATARRATRHPSAKAAVARLEALWAALAGPSRSSLDGLIRDARESLYRDALRHWAALMPGEWLRPAPFDPARPGAALVNRVRGFPLHGLDLRDEIGGRMEPTIRGLKAALAAAGSRGLSGRQGPDLIHAWATRAKDSLFTAVRIALSDSAVFADRLAGRDVCRPEVLDDDPTLPA